MIKRVFLCWALMALSAAAICQTLSGKQATTELAKVGQEARTAGLSQGEVSAKLAEKARQLIGERNPAQIPGEEAADWAQVFRSAGREDDSLALDKKAYQYMANSMRVVQENLVRGLIREEKFDELFAVLKRPVAVIGAPAIGMLGDTIRYGLDKYRTTRPELLNKCYDLLLDQISLDRPVSDSDRNWEPYVYASLHCLKLDLMLQEGKKDEAIQGLKALRKKMEAYPNSKNAMGQPPTALIDSLLKKAEMADAPAPEITIDAKIGNFPGLKAWRGKVVIVDFFAHWCGPCIRSFPTLRQYLDDYKDKGLEIVGVTSYYGYYGATRDIAVADELEAVKSKFIPQHKMTWPVVFDAKQATQNAYGVQGIPHLVIVDRKGNIRRVEVGFNADHESEIRRLIEACLAEQ